MNILDNTKKNLMDMAVFLHETAALDVSQLGSEWEARRILIKKHAIFLDTYTIPDMTDAAMVAQFSPPQRNGSALYAGPLEGEEVTR